MYKQCSSEKSAAQQRYFESVFLEMLQTIPYDEVFVSDLCKKAGLSRKTFYRLYDTKSDLVYAMIDHAIMDGESFVPDESVGPGGMHKFLAYWKHQKPLLDVLEKNNINALLAQQAMKHVMAESPEIRGAFGADNSVEGRDTMLFLLTGLFALVLDWHSKGYDRTIDELAASIMRFLTKPAIPYSEKGYEGVGNWR